jgi:hypothetical protein
MRAGLGREATGGYGGRRRRRLKEGRRRGLVGADSGDCSNGV